MEIGYWLSSEEHSPRDLVEHAKAAEDAGFEHLVISDHFHPWVDEQGHSPFVWSVIGGIAEATDRIRLGTGVTCPLIRIHPALVAQAAATSAAMMPGRFFLGVGTGENLNEHILGDKWPRGDVRLEMLEEAVDVMRELWGGDYVTHRGRRYTVEQARLYTVPDEPVPVVVAAAETNAARRGGERRRLHEHVAGRGDAAGVQGRRRLRPVLRQGHGRVRGVARGGPRDRAQAVAEHGARRVALAGPRPPAGLRGRGEDRPARGHRGLARARRRRRVWREKIDEWRDAGFTHLTLHNVAPEQRAFIEFARQFVA